MTKVYINHDIKPVSYISKPRLQVWRDNFIGEFKYTTTGEINTVFENCLCTAIVLFLFFLTFMGCKKYIIPLIAMFAAK